MSNLLRSFIGKVTYQLHRLFREIEEVEELEKWHFPSSGQVCVEIQMPTWSADVSSEELEIVRKHVFDLTSMDRGCWKIMAVTRSTKGWFRVHLVSTDLQEQLERALSQ